MKTALTMTPQQEILKHFTFFKFFQNSLKLLNVYFWGDNVYFWGDKVYFGDSRGFWGFWNLLFVVVVGGGGGWDSVGLGAL